MDFSLSSIIPVREMSLRQREFLDAFKKDLEVPCADRDEVKCWFANVQNILNKAVPSNSNDPQTERAYALQERYKWPLLGERSNVYVISSLKEEMKTALEEKSKQLRSRLSFQEMLSIIPPYQIEAFLMEVNFTCHRNLSEGISPEKAFGKALAYGLSRSLIETNDMIGEEKIRPHICPIAGDVIESQPVHLREDSQEEPREMYHERDITWYLVDSKKDPITREHRTVKDIRKNPLQKEKGREVICSLKYPHQKMAEAALAPPFALPDPSVFIAACIGYPLAKEVYAKAVIETADYNLAAAQAENVEALAIDLFAPFVRDSSESDFRFLKWKPKEAKEFTNAQRWNSFSLSYNSPRSGISSLNMREVQTQFMQAFLKHQIDVLSELGDVESVRSRLSGQMHEYINYVQEVHKLDIPEYEKKELESKALTLILTEPSSDSSSSYSKKRSLDSLRTESKKRVRSDPSDANVQMEMLSRFFL